MNRFKLVALLIIFTLAITGVNYLSYLLITQPHSEVEDVMLVDYPKGAAVFYVQKGNWTAFIVGSNPMNKFTSSTFTEVSEWAINQTIGKTK